jgi:hypothetical protein
MRVRVRGDGEVALADVLADPRPRHPAQVQERDSAVARAANPETVAEYNRSRRLSPREFSQRRFS